MPDASEAGPPRTQRRFTLSRRQWGAASPPADLGPSPTSTPTRRLPFYLGGDVLADAAARLPFTAAGRAAYADDWTSGAFWGVLAPATHVCLLSLIPALAFGEQAAEETGGAVTGASVLASTALFGVAQALVGGQPLLIVGVAEPLVLLYSYLAAFARRASLPFLPFAAWSCAWAAAFLAAAALGGAGRGVSRFTRFSSDLFGALVGGALFMQQAVALVVRQFRGGEEGGGGSEEAARAWALANGTWGLFIAVGLLVTILAARRARGWSVGPPGLRALVAEVAAPLGVAAWSGVAYAVRAPTAGALVPPPGILPRPLTLPAPWEAGPMSAWSVAGRMGGLGAKWAAAAAIPGLMVAVLFYFDHTIVQRVALPDGCSPPPPAGEPARGSMGTIDGRVDGVVVTPQAHHHKRPTYAWDLAALSLMTLAAGLLGLPPVNGVLPQAPMHTHALAVAAREHESRAARRRAKRPGAAAAGPLPGPPPPLALPWRRGSLPCSSPWPSAPPRAWPPRSWPASPRPSLRATLRSWPWKAWRPTSLRFACGSWRRTPRPARPWRPPRARPPACPPSPSPPSAPSRCSSSPPWRPCTAGPGSPWAASSSPSCCWGWCPCEPSSCPASSARPP